MDQSRLDLVTTLDKTLRKHDVAAATRAPAKARRSSKSSPHGRRRKGSGGRSHKKSRGSKSDYKPACTHWKKGRCNRGDGCAFYHHPKYEKKNRHNAAPAPATGPSTSGPRVEYQFKDWEGGNKPCMKFSRGLCKRGDQCDYKHRDLVPWEIDFRNTKYEKGNAPGSGKGLSLIHI